LFSHSVVGVTTTSTRSPAQTQRRRLLLSLPPAVVAAFVSVVCVLLMLFLAGLAGAFVTGIAAVAGAVWGASIVFSLPRR
jgi:hypothetical protein